MIEKTEDAPLWESLKENTIAVERIAFIQVCSKVCITVAPLLWGDNDAVCGMPADKWSWLSSTEDTSMAISSEDPETNAHVRKYDIDLDEYNKTLDELEAEWYVNSPDTGNLFTLESNSTQAHFATSEANGMVPYSALRVLRSRDLYLNLMAYFHTLCEYYGHGFLETCFEHWLEETPLTTLDMPGFHGSQPNCLRGVFYISLNLYLLKMWNHRKKHLGPDLSGEDGGEHGHDN